MLIAGTEDGAYRVTGVTESRDTDVQTVLDAPRVERVRQFDAVDGVFAGTAAGLYYAHRGRDWVDLQVPKDTVWAVTVSPSGDRVFAGTVPTHVYVSSVPDDVSPQQFDWRELEGFRQLPSRDEWGVPRHNNVARVRDLCIHPESPDRLVTGVEPGGVHVSTDRGETWEERNDGVHDDVHSLQVVTDGEYVAATGRGLYRTVNAGQSWTRLDEDVEQRYFRTVYQYDGNLYASAACVPPSNRWETPEADPALFVCCDGQSLERVGAPCLDEVVVGWTQADGTLVGATHRGTILRTRGSTWKIVGDLPSTETVPGCYYSLSWVGSGVV